MKPKVANASSLGSLGFGMTTILYSIVGAGFFSINTMLISMAIFLGGVTQIIAGLLEYKKGNTFGYVSYTMFGLFWFTSASMTLMPFFVQIHGANSMFMGLFYLLWTVFTVMLYLQTLKMDKLTNVIFLTVVILFGTITVSNFTGIKLVGNLAGWIGIICGSLAMYSAHKGLSS
ncbi:MAG: acetate uptake transporter [bacterium]|nr:acetate uptake transporter [bacterium]